ncbi:hypothetical protein [Ralstonia sp. 24A2]|uniref:hypothetical protein n=1 Tax=Ralstonia sp. 24A2 TaxID=3447364 RepID=UPI003F6A4D99
MRNVAQSKEDDSQSKIFESIAPRMGGLGGLISYSYSGKIQSALVRMKLREARHIPLIDDIAVAAAQERLGGVGNCFEPQDF